MILAGDGHLTCIYTDVHVSGWVERGWGLHFTGACLFGLVLNRQKVEGSPLALDLYLSRSVTDVMVTLTDHYPLASYRFYLGSKL